MHTIFRSSKTFSINQPFEWYEEFLPKITSCRIGNPG
jgi:hypothetical protein